jgi:hypothetical protein
MVVVRSCIASAAGASALVERQLEVASAVPVLRSAAESPVLWLVDQVNSGLANQETAHCRHCRL